MSPGLTVPDFFLWGCLKGRIYRNNPQNIQELELNIRDEISNIDRDTLARMFRNFQRRLDVCIDTEGSRKIIVKILNNEKSVKNGQIKKSFGGEKLSKSLEYMFKI